MPPRIPANSLFGKKQNSSSTIPAERPGSALFGVTSRVAIFALLLLSTLFARGQAEPANRLSQPIDSANMVTLKGTVSPLAQPRLDTGVVDGNTRLDGMSIDFKPSNAQQADLAQLLKDQQDPASPNYHRWLTPGQYASRFGVSSGDLAQVQAWLQLQGFTVNETPATRNRIVFSGNAAQFHSAFQTELHRFQINGRTHIANASAISLPASLAGMLLGVRNLSDFRPRPRIIPRPLPQYTSSASGDHFVAPGDFATIYNINPQYNAGYTGSGKTIVIVGQSAIKAADVANFRSASGLPANTPTLTLIPNTGTSVTTDTNGDEDESDLDVEWSGAVAKAATIQFVYVGNSQNYSVMDALQYAINHDLAPVISISYGACEADYPKSEVNAIQQWLQQANAQGETVIAAAGDEGAADCDIDSGQQKTIVNGDQATKGLAVDYPGTSPNVTSIGGTEFNEGSGDYWNSGSGLSGSAVSYIPEKVWNDTSAQAGVEAGGGGVSTLFGKPSWQSGTGVPADGVRDVPDLSLNASPNHDGYLFCASGNDATSCSNGFRDSSSNLTVAGGTSFGAPTFAGILTLINQQLASSGQGNVNPLLYTIAAATPAAFHDTSVGNNEIPCRTGSPDCGASGQIGYAAAAGYDVASGWGSVDGNNLAQAFVTQVAASGTTLVATTTDLTASVTAPTVNQSITFTAAVSADSGASVPTGTVQFALDGSNAGSAVTLSSGAASYVNSFATSGSHSLVASYSGDSTHGASSATLHFTVGAGTTSKGSFTLSATNVTVAAGSSGTSTLTVTPSGGYTGTVAFSATVSGGLTNSCYILNNVTVTGSSPVTSSLTIETSATQCQSSNMIPLSANMLKKSASAERPGTLMRLGGLGVTLASVFLFGFGKIRNRRATAWLAVAVLGVLTLGVGCGGATSNTGTQTTGSTIAAPGSYTVTLTGTDTANSSLSSSTTLTLTVH